MTKAREPLSFDSALAEIAGLLGWARMAFVVSEACGRDVKERTVRDWGDPDTGRQCPIDAAVALDLAFQAKGGAGAPMHRTYSLIVEQASSDRFADQQELLRRTGTVIQAEADAEQALIRATVPGATPADMSCARAFVERGVAALTATLPLLTMGETEA